MIDPIMQDSWQIFVVNTDTVHKDISGRVARGVCILSVISYDETAGVLGVY